MEKGIIVNVIIGVLFLAIGGFFTFKPNLTYQKESTGDIWAILGIIFMIVGVILLFSPLIR